jgi:hypothetical protein
LDLRDGWTSDIGQVLVSAEQAESDLTYLSDCVSENARKRSGSYYTPADVADFFWNIFFARNRILTSQDAVDLIDDCIFVEPSVGSGVLLFSLIKRLVLIGVAPAEIRRLRIDLVDLNAGALRFAAGQMSWLEQCWGVRFEGVKFINSDFLNYSLVAGLRRPVFFGNPPFVTNRGGASRWKNLFADFVERSLNQRTEAGALNYIVPLSLTFSRDYRLLRAMLREANMDVSVANFDNIPDTLFKSGKPRHLNTNKANSQRCTILTATPATVSKLHSTVLHRWSRHDRSQLLSSAPKYMDVTDYRFDDQFPRPASEVAYRYLNDSISSKRFSSLVSEDGEFRLYVAAVARNYVGFRDELSEGGHVIRFKTKTNFLLALGILSSDIFYGYWLSVGDGFHVTKANILNFPISVGLEANIRRKFGRIEVMWRERAKFEKTKLNSGKELRSFDFSSAAASM